MKARLQSNQGFGLLEILIGITLFGIISWSNQQVLATSLRGTKTVKVKADFESLVTEVKLVLGSNRLCPTALYDSQDPPQVASFHPLSVFENFKLVSSVRQGPTVLVAENQKIGSLTITSLDLIEVDAAARQVPVLGQHSYLVNLRIVAKPDDTSFLKNEITRDIPLMITTDNNTHQILSCGSASPGRSIRIEGSVKLTPIIAPGCDSTGECYCGGLETVHRKTDANETGSPYKHGADSPYNTERPRPWVGTLTCPEGYAAGVAGAKCGNLQGSSGKLENIYPETERTVVITCCAYTNDDLANSARTLPGSVEAFDKISLVCIKAGAN